MSINSHSLGYEIDISPVYGGYDLTITHQQRSAVLFIQDKEQAQVIADNIISIATMQKLNINAALAVFNSGSQPYA